MRFFLAIVLLIAATVLPGCWDLTEMEDLSYITSIGVDSGHDGGELRLTAEASLPQGSKSGGGGAAAGDSGPVKRRNIIYTASGKSLLAAVNRLQQIMEQRLFLGFVGTIVIGDEAARKDMPEILDFLDRSRDLRRSTYVLITPGKASEVLSTVGPRGASVNEAIGSMLDLTKQTGDSFDTRTGINIFHPLSTGGIEPIAARIIATRSQTPSTGQQGQNGSSTGGTMPGDPGSQGILQQQPGLLRVSGMAVFRGTELAGWFNEKETRGWRWVSGQIAQGYIVSATPLSSQSETDLVTFRCLGGKSSIKFKLDDGKLTATVTIKARGEVQQGAGRLDLLNPETIRSLEADLANSIKSDIEATLEKSQRELKSDVFGFGFQLSRKHRREWNQEYKDTWLDIFPSIPINVNVLAKIQNTGTVIRELKLNP